MDLELGQLGYEPIPAESLTRLIDAVGKLDRSKAAMASRLARDLYQAERFEKLARSVTQGGWAPYWVLKARDSVRAGDSQAAEDALALVRSEYRDRPSYLLAELETARAVGDIVRLQSAERAVEDATSVRWSGLKWRTERSRPVLEMLPEVDAEGFAFKVPAAARDGVVIQVLFNGNTVQLQQVYQGDTVRAAADIKAGKLHLIEIRFIAGGSVAPGETWLLAE